MPPPPHPDGAEGPNEDGVDIADLWVEFELAQDSAIEDAVCKDHIDAVRQAINIHLRRRRHAP